MSSAELSIEALVTDTEGGFSETLQAIGWQDPVLTAG